MQNVKKFQNVEYLSYYKMKYSKQTRILFINKLYKKTLKKNTGKIHHVESCFRFSRKCNRQQIECFAILSSMNAGVSLCVLCRCVQRELRQLCRLGFPTQYRADIWKRLIYAKVADVRADKGDHYYRHLVMRSHDSPVSEAADDSLVMMLTTTIIVADVTNDVVKYNAVVT